MKLTKTGLKRIILDFHVDIIGFPQKIKDVDNTPHELDLEQF